MKNKCQAYGPLARSILIFLGFCILWPHVSHNDHVLCNPNFLTLTLLHPHSQPKILLNPYSLTQNFLTLILGYIIFIG